jgi:hypothetical protein
MPRKTNKIQSHATILLVLEGQTEQLYFSEMRIIERIPGITIIPKMAQHSDLYHVLKNAKIENETGVYDSIWCIFDTDTLIKNSISSELAKLIGKCKDLGIKFADSFPAFEIWFLLHYEIPKITYTNQNEVIKSLLKYISDYSKEKKWIESKHLYSFLKDLQKSAITRAKELESKDFDSLYKSYCNVYKVIEEVISHK